MERHLSKIKLSLCHKKMRKILLKWMAKYDQSIKVQWIIHRWKRHIFKAESKVSLATEVPRQPVAVLDDHIGTYGTAHVPKCLVDLFGCLLWLLLFELFAFLGLVDAEFFNDWDQQICGPLLAVIYCKSTNNRDIEVKYLRFPYKMGASLCPRMLMNVQINHYGVVHVRPTDHKQ